MAAGAGVGAPYGSAVGIAGVGAGIAGAGAAAVYGSAVGVGTAAAYGSATGAECRSGRIVRLRSVACPGLGRSRCRLPDRRSVRRLDRSSWP